MKTALRALALLALGIAAPALAAAPTVTTGNASSVTATTAVLNGSTNPNGESTTGWFRHSTTHPGTCDDVFGTRVPGTGGTGVGNGTTNVGYTVSTTGLLPGTTYYYCAIASNASGTAFGSVLSFTTPALAPAMATTSATNVTSGTAELEGTVNPNGSATTAFYRYSTSNPGSCNNTFGTRAPTTGGFSAGSGNASTAYVQPISGLLAGVTYYFCAIGQNSVGTSYGAVLSFTTLVAAPAVTTSGASSITGTSVTLSGTANPNGSSTSAWFRYSSSNPGGCNDAFGTRAPASGGSSMGSGSSALGYSQGLSGLTPGTTYYYCAIAQNSVGTSFGNVLTFSTPAAPTVTTSAATSVLAQSATLNGSANPEGASTTGWFRYSTVNPGVCNDTFGSRAPSSGGSSLGAGSAPVTFSQPTAALLPGNTYYYCAIAQNSVGTSFGSVLTLTTPPLAPAVTTQAALPVTGTTATLNSSVNPRGDSTTAWFRYSTASPGTCNDTFGTRAPATGGTAIGSGNTTTSVSEALTGLTPGTTYYYCALASNSVGTTLGSVQSFLTPNAPTVTTTAASGISGTSANLNGTVNPNGAFSPDGWTTAWFRYSTTSPGTCNDSFGLRAPTSGATTIGDSNTTSSYVRSISGLTPGTTYYFCAIASNAVGTSFGAVLSFTTPGVPVVTTSPVTNLTATGATLNGSASPEGASTSGWFRYDTTNPGTCSDSFGLRAPASGYASLGAGSTPVAYAQSTPTLLPGTTYYYCAIAQNSVGSGFGQVLSFTTPPTAPLVTTSSASSITGTSVTLNGSANPRGAATTSWFRYATSSPGACNDTFGTRAPGTGGFSVGSGNSTTSFFEAVPGLTPGTTYYYCAIASNSEGTSFGSVLSFSTPDVPVVTTTAATFVTGTTAQLNGTANPNRGSTTAWFRYATTSPGTCNDTFGSRWPSTGGASMGSGTTAGSYNYSVTGLQPGTTYYFCAIANNLVGTGFGSVLSFTTPGAPTITTLTATGITATGATLEATGTPNGASSTGWFRYHTVNPGTCNDTFGTRAPVSGGTALGSGNSPVAFSVTPAGLLPGTTYYFCAIGQNSVGTSYGAVLSFSTPATAPIVATSGASSITSSSVTLNGAANPRGDTASGWFRYSSTHPGSCNDSFGIRSPASGATALGAGNSNVPFSQAISGLSLATTYYYCAIASNSVGTSFGSVVSFTTAPAAPSVTTLAASGVTTTTSTMNATATPNGAASTGWFRFSPTNPGTCSDTFGTRVPASGGTALGSGTSPVAYSVTPAALSPGETYYYCAIAQNSAGTSFGAVLSFTTVSTPPSTLSLAATSVSGTTAQLNGSANPNGDAATGWFRYATTHPGSCNDTFGTRAPGTGGTSLGSGTSSTPFDEALTGLTPGTTYYFCAIAQNSVGTTFGNVLSFATPNAPTVSTGPASPVTATSATLNGSAAGNGNAATAWFRYSATDPGSCNDTFGTRAPTTGGSAVGSTGTATNYAQAVSGLLPGTTYYFCAIASNSVGTSLGALLSFTTPPTSPTVATLAPSNVTASSAELNATTNPNGATTTGWFRYATSNPGSCNDSFGTRAPSTGGNALGTGSAAVTWSQPITGLSPGTTYYFCPIASNSVGTTFGGIVSFTTPAAPLVSTTAATAVSTTTATIHGNANPRGAQTTAWFRYSATDPGTCNDSFGTRAPSSGGTAMGSGTSVGTYSEALTGLSPGTTYYVCAIASNVVGTSFGSVVPFTTASAPSVTTLATTGITSVGAVLNGSANPNGGSATGWFRYSATDPGTCNDTFGIRAPTSGGTALGAGSTPVSFTRTISGLAPGTTYYACAIASNVSGTTFGALQTFTTLAAPAVTTLAASAVTSTGATLHGTGDPRGDATTGFFRFSTTSPGTCNNTFGTRAPTSGGTSLGSGQGAQPFSQALSGLLPGTTYYACALATNSVGTSVGTVISFTTLAAPSVTTAAASSVSSTSATLNGSANPRADATTAWFRYATSSPGTCNDTFGTRAPSTGGFSLGSGTSAASFFEALPGLNPGTTYYFCAIAQNSVGTSFGTVLSFTTLDAPAVTTLAATGVGGSAATLNGSATPNGAAATGWFRYSAVNPGTCNDTFGTRAPTTGGSALGSGSSAVSFTQALSGLTPSTTYYYCALAQNSVGTSLGSVMSFTTLSAPLVTTVAASGVTGTSASLNGSTNPNGQAATGWFRLSTTDPGTCSDSFGTRYPTSGGTALGSGTSAVSYTQLASGLQSGTTYYYCALASSPVGTSVGAVLSFTTPGAPTVATAAASSVTSSGATLNGAASPNGSAATGWFRYSTSSPGTCNDFFGTRAPASGGTALGSGSSSAPYSQTISGLQPGTTYYVCAIASNSIGTSVGTVQSFSTGAVAPTVSTLAATSVTGSSATLNGSANPGGATATGWFRYDTVDPGTCDDTFGTRAPTSGGSNLGAGTSSTSFTRSITGLSPSTTYYFCAIASNAQGLTFGTVLSFTTPTAPTVTTGLVSGAVPTGGTLNATANPNGVSSTGWFRYGTVDPGTCNDTFGTRAPGLGGTSLGSGTGSVAFSYNLTGLTPGATYYYCALASSSAGTSFGAVLSFTTPTAPTVVTFSVSNLTATSVTLEGAADPRGAATTGFFRYSTLNPGSCSNSFGFRAPASGGASLGSGFGPVSYTQAVTTLTPGTTYYFCALASNSVGTSFGAVQTFTTPATPTVATTAASNVTGTSVTLNGSANPRGEASTGWFRYATTNPGTCNDTFGTRAPASGGMSLGSGTSPVAYFEAVPGLTPGTTYFFCAIAGNSVGNAFGAVLSFTTPNAPNVLTLAATAVGSTSATLNGSGNPRGDAATGWFRYSTSNPGTCNDTFGTRAPTSSGTSLGAGTTPVSFSQTVSGLTSGTTYYYCAIASNSVGLSFGALLTVTTQGAPTVTTSSASNVTSSGATLNGSATPNGAPTTGWFRYSTTNPGSCSDSFGTRAPGLGGAALGSGTTPAGYSQAISGLVPGATYYYCAIASNSVGLAFGTLSTFTTPAAVPVVITNAATLVTSTGATLNGAANPGGAAATGWFRYATANPGACNDSFGTRAPGTGGTSLGSLNSMTSYNFPVTGLTPGTTYYFCAIASSSAGKGYGSVLTFSTPAAPAITTLAATNVTGTAVVLNGSGNPNGALTTAWFRYAATSPGTCNDTFGSRTPQTGGTSLGAGSTTSAFSSSVPNLMPGTTYYFCAVGQNSVGKSFGALLTFKTPGAPVVTTSSASNVTSSTATMNGSANPNGASATGWFRYAAVDPGTCNDSFGNRLPATGGAALGAGGTAVGYSQPVTDLAPGVTYYFCAVAQNAVGTSFGEVLSFTVDAPVPVVITEEATDLEARGATLHGSANPNRTATTGWFRYDVTDPGTCNDTFGTRVPAEGGLELGAGSAATPYELALTELKPNGTYFYCAIASNQGGAGFGEVRSFKTVAIGPTVQTLPVTEGEPGVVTLNALGQPNGSEATGWFRYDKTNPQVCNFVFGSQVPVSGVPLGAGHEEAAFSEVMNYLAPGTYYYCAVVVSPAGTAYGEVLSFEITGGAAGGCGCSSAAASGTTLPWVALAFGVLAWAGRRTRRRR